MLKVIVVVVGAEQVLEVDLSHPSVEVLSVQLWLLGTLSVVDMTCTGQEEMWGLTLSLIPREPTIGLRAVLLVILRMVVGRDGRGDLITRSKETNPPLAVGVYGLLGSERADGGVCLMVYSTPGLYCT